LEQFCILRIGRRLRVAVATVSRRRPNTGTAYSATAGSVAGKPNEALEKEIKRIVQVVEAYPDLKADATLAELTEELTSTENRIGFARQSFNDAVTDYNTAIERFPVNMVSIAFGFRPARLLQATRSHAERQPVAVTL
jgi:LemA protein